MTHFELGPMHYDNTKRLAATLRLHFVEQTIKATATCSVFLLLLLLLVFILKFFIPPHLLPLVFCTCKFSPGLIIIAKVLGEKNCTCI